MTAHPHPSAQHIVSTYRHYILGCKKKFGTARGLVHYRQLIAIYLAAKQELFAERSKYENRATN